MSISVDNDTIEIIAPAFTRICKGKFHHEIMNRINKERTHDLFLTYTDGDNIYEYKLTDVSICRQDGVVRCTTDKEIITNATFWLSSFLQPDLSSFIDVFECYHKTDKIMDCGNAILFNTTHKYLFCNREEINEPEFRANPITFVQIIDEPGLSNNDNFAIVKSQFASTN